MSGGERQGRREAMDRMVRRMVETGSDREYAQQKARESAIRKDRREDTRPKKAKPKQHERT